MNPPKKKRTEKEARGRPLASKKKATKKKDSEHSPPVSKRRRTKGSSEISSSLSRSGSKTTRTKSKERPGISNSTGQGSGSSSRKSSTSKVAPSRTFTLRGYARHRKKLGLAGGTLSAVQKAIAFGRITPEESGRIDPVKADRQWSENTDQKKAPKDPSSCKPKTPQKRRRSRARGGTEILESEDFEEFTFASERAKKERIERILKELELKQRQGELVEVSVAASVNFRVARQIRSRLEIIPERNREILAAESDPQTVEEILRSEIRAVLELLGADPSAAAVSIEKDPADE